MRAKVSWPILLLFLAISVSSLLYFPGRHELILRGALREKAQAVARVVAHDAAPSLDFDDHVLARQILAGAASDVDVVYLELYRRSGELFEEIGQKKENNIAGSIGSSRESFTRGGLMEIEQPVVGEAGELGMLRAGFSTSRVAAEARSYHQLIFFMSVVVFAAGLATSFRVGASVHRARVLADEANEARDAAERAANAKSLFLTNMSHEIRTPMNAVIGMNDLMKTTELTKQQLEYSDAIESSAATLLALINDILDFSKLDAGEVILRRDEFDLYDLVAQTCRALAWMAHRKGLELLFRIRPQAPRYVVGDADRLRQVLTNLIGNAIKFTSKGEVVVEVEPASEGRLRFEVRDTGIGIEANDLELLFLPFRQVDETHTRQYGGTGLGLAISYDLVRTMGGTLEVDSEPGVGSSFSFVVDLATVVAEAVPEKRTGLVGKRVLVVEPNVTSREIVVDLLAEVGIEAEAVPDGPQALRRLEAKANRGAPFDVIIVASRMPVMDGSAFARRVQRDAVLFGSPKIVLLATFQDTIKGMTGDVEQWLVKPVSRKRLHDAIETALGGTLSPERSRPNSREVLSSSRTRVLLVDDNDLNLLVARDMLRELGYMPDVAVNGQSALELLLSKRYDFVFMDCQMPVLDGYETTRLLRESAGGSSSAVIVALTAHADPEDREKALAAGMNDYLVKPVTIEAFSDVLERHLSKDDSFDDEAIADRLVDPSIARSPKVLGLFLKLGPEQLANIVSAAAAEDLMLAAHTLRGSALNLGLDRLAAACKEVEAAAKEGDIDAAREQIPGLERSFAETIEALQTSARGANG